MERAVNFVISVIPKNPIMSHDKGSTRCLCKGLFKRRFPFKQIIWGLGLFMCEAQEQKDRINKNF